MVKNLTQLTPVRTSVTPNTMAPMSAVHGTTVSSYGQLSARAFIGLGVAKAAVTTDANPGSPPREAPV
ncbi:MAG: hypothetical protein JJD92_07250 [Frankiaceae bacterium]|nr:hypothetical protein [Frankiaceae bacterium]